MGESEFEIHLIYMGIKHCVLIAGCEISELKEFFPDLCFTIWRASNKIFGLVCKEQYLLHVKDFILKCGDNFDVQLGKLLGYINPMIMDQEAYESLNTCLMIWYIDGKIFTTQRLYNPSSASEVIRIDNDYVNCKKYFREKFNLDVTIGFEF